MSFSSEAKDALCATVPKRFCCKMALIYGYLYSGISLDRIMIQFDTPRIREYFFMLFFEVFSIELENSSDIVIEDRFTMQTLSDVLAIGDGISISEIVYSCASCSQSFMKGFYLANASISDPAKEYHLEFSGLSDVHGKEVKDFFSLQGIPLRETTRKGKLILYYKSTQLIERFLSYIGASKALFGVLNAKMIGEERNAINRLTNFENANLNRTVSASSDQVSAAKKLQQIGKLQLLSTELQESALLRIKHPDASLAALAALHEPPITKSGLTHRLKKIVEISKEEI